MNAGFDDDELEFTAVGVEPNKQSNDPPPEFTGTKPASSKVIVRKSNFYFWSRALQLSYKSHVF